MTGRPLVLALLCGLAAVGLWRVPLIAHDLPADVVVHAFIKPEGQRLRVLLRVPLGAMADVDYATRGPEGLLDLTQIDRALRDAATMWVIPGLQVFEGEAKLAPPQLAAVQLSLPSDRSFSSYEDALAHVTGTGLSRESQVYWNQALLDVLLDYDIQSERSAFAIRPALARLGVHVVTALRFLSPGSGERAFEWTGDPGLVRLDPRWHQAALSFVRLGFKHILTGTDHLLFLVCLVIPIRRLRALVPVVTAFAAAHSLTLIASAFKLAPDGLWFPPLIELLIAVSIVYMALENMLAARFDHRWVVAFGFGLVHGFGFSFALRESLQFAGAHLVTSLLSFNIGVELGQLFVLAVIIPPLIWLYRMISSERLGTIVLSALVAHTAWHWMVERGATLSQFAFQWPEVDAAFAAKAAGWGLLGVSAAGLMWALSVVASRMGGTPGPKARRPHDESSATGRSY